MGKGVIDSKGNINGKLYFSFKSQRDGTFIQFSDILGRKTKSKINTPIIEIFDDGSVEKKIIIE